MTAKYAIDESDKDADVATFHFSERLCVDAGEAIELYKALNACEGVNRWRNVGEYALYIEKARLFKWDAVTTNVISAVLASTRFNGFESIPK